MQFKAVNVDWIPQGEIISHYLGGMNILLQQKAVYVKSP
jgi:hypothetical protein